MGLVNQTLPGLYNGVSQQPDELRLDTQVEEMVNCYPSIVEGVQKRPPTIHVADDTMPDDVFVHTYDRGAGDEQYIIVVQDGMWRSYDADTGLPVLSMAWQTNAYLDLPTDAKAADSFSMVTVGDTSYVVNKTKTAAQTTTISDNGDSDWENTFFYWVKRTTEIRFGVDAEDTKGYTYYIYNASGSQVGTFEGSDGVAAATNLATDIGGSSKGSVVKKTGAGAYSGSDSWGAQASESWVGKVSKLQDLPRDLMFTGSVIEISGDAKSNFDNYYVKFEDGVYNETYRPGLANAIDPATMPYKIERLGDDATVPGSFEMSIIDWSDRKVGDDDNASAPSFIDRTIEDIFFYKNRLGLLSGDNIIMSETGEYYNFWPTTVTDILDSDPIDVAVDSNHAVHLIYALPFNKELLVFGDKAQFILSASKALTPKDVNIQQSTAYTVNSKVTPITLGPNVFFITDRQTSSIVREYFVVPDTANNTAANITSHCPSYIPNGIIKMTGSEKHDMLFCITGTDNRIFVYNFYWQGDEKAQSAWHTWELEAGSEIFNIEVMEHNLLVMVKHTDGTKSLETINLELPADIDTIHYGDHTTATTPGTETIQSRIEMSKWGMPTGKSSVDSNRSTLILRDLQLSMADNSWYGIEITRGAVTNTWYNYDATTMTPLGDHKYTVVGNANNIKVAFVSNTNKGFKLNSLSWRGLLHQKGQGV